MKYTMHHSDALMKHSDLAVKAITIRNLPPEIKKIIQPRAKQKKTSVDKAVIGLLEESV